MTRPTLVLLASCWTAILTTTFSVVTTSVSASSQADPIEINSDPGRKLPHPRHSEFIGIRHIIDEFVFLHPKGKLGIPEDVIKGAAASQKEMVVLLKERGISVNPMGSFNELNVGAIIETVKSHPDIAMKLYSQSSTPSHWSSEDFGTPKVVMSAMNEGVAVNYSPTAVLNMLGTNLIETQDPETIELFGANIVVYPLNSKFSADVIPAYRWASGLGGFNDRVRGKQLSQVVNAIREYDEAQKALLVRLGDITFGQPLVQTSKELGLKLSSYIDRLFDVYFVELSVSYRDLPVQYLKELAFNVQLPRSHIALQLIPLRYGTRVAVEETTRSPDFEVEIGGNRVSVGEFYGRQIRFSYLRPTISAPGLQESAFSWSVRDEAISTGSHPFVAIVGVPKGKNALTIEMSAHAMVSRFGWLAGDIAGSRVEVFNLELN